MTARDEVVAALRDSVPEGITVMPYSRSADAVSGPTVMVRVDEVRPSDQPQAFREYQFSLLVITDRTEPGVADAELDALLEDVLYALDQSRLPVWTNATPANFEDAFPCYQVALNVTVTKE